jgi:hypothetical protein
VGPKPAGNGRAQTQVTSADIVRTNALQRSRVIVRRLGPWSVFRFSLLYTLSVMLVVYLALVILYTILGALGVLDTVVKLMVNLGAAEKGFGIDGGWIFSRLFVIGLVLVVLWSVLKLISAVIYNLVSDIVGGVEVTLAERR